MTDDRLQRRDLGDEGLEVAIEQLIASRQSKNTRTAYRADWGKWSMFARAKGANLTAPGIETAAAFRDALVEQNYAPSSIQRILATCSFFYGALRDVGIVRSNPFNRAWVARPKQGKARKTPSIDDALAESLMDSIPIKTERGKRDLAILRVLYDTGMRRASVAALKRDQLIEDGGGLLARITIKGGREQDVWLTEAAETALRAWLRVAPKSRYVFPARRRADAPMNPNTVNKIIAARARGLADGVHPHRFRAAFITAAYDAHLYERDIQSAAGHASADTTRGYDRGARGDRVFDQVSDFRKKRRRGESPGGGDVEGRDDE